MLVVDVGVDRSAKMQIYSGKFLAKMSKRLTTHDIKVLPFIEHFIHQINVFVTGIRHF